MRKRIYISVLIFFCCCYSFQNIILAQSISGLHEAIKKGDSLHVERIIEKDNRAVFLLDSITGATPLHYAVQGGNVHIVQKLVEAGALYNQPSGLHGMTPLMVAVWHQNIDIVRYLLTIPDIYLDAQSADGRNVFDMLGKENKNDNSVIESPLSEIEKLLKEAKNRQIIDKHSKQMIHIIIDSTLEDSIKATKVASLLLKGADVNYVYPCGHGPNSRHTPLLIAARDGHTKTVKVLLDAGADMTITCGLMKATPAHKAAYMGNNQVMRLLVDHPDFKKIIDQQGPFNGYTALHDAVWQGHTDIVKILLDAGAAIDLKGWDGLTAYELAEKYNRTEIINLFENYGK
ncbi:ankyrin repeat domain-containing protein [Niabella digestorum]|uniref:Ankyrin repeat domain-containing protein n=1 Tax=Niabella digestorum TaxID=3117701 RepID=A0ABU7RJW1_9BACT